ncbi:MAG: NADH-ubiquinone oxidoreductase chain M, partial [uncultured Gemmatimonadetes bacterium]
ELLSESLDPHLPDRVPHGGRPGGVPVGRAQREADGSRRRAGRARRLHPALLRLRPQGVVHDERGEERAHGGAARRHHARLHAVRGLHLVPRVGDPLPHRAGRDLALHGAAHHPPPPADGAGVVDVHPRPRAGLLRLAAGAHGGRGGGVRVAGPLPVLHVLGDGADPDVLPDRDLGRQGAHLRGGQVLSVHGGGLAADAGGHPVPVLALQRHHRRGDRQLLVLRLPDAGADRHRADDALPGVRAGLRGQGAHLPLPHLAAARARAGAHGGVGGAGGRAAQDGDVRLHPLRPPALPGRVGQRGGGEVGDDPGAGGDHLRGAGGGGAAQRQEAGGVHLGGPPGFRDPGRVRLQPAGDAGGAARDDRPRPLHPHAVLPAGDAVRAASFVRDRRLRRAGGLAPRVLHPAGVRGHDHHRAAGHERLRERVPGAAGDVPDQPVRRADRRHGGDLRLVLHAAHGAADDLQRAGPAGQPPRAGLERARARHPPAAGRADPVAGRVPQARTGPHGARREARARAGRCFAPPPGLRRPGRRRRPTV